MGHPPAVCRVPYTAAGFKRTAPLPLPASDYQYAKGLSGTSLETVPIGAHLVFQLFKSAVCTFLPVNAMAARSASCLPW
jgi:hypothetical protein